MSVSSGQLCVVRNCQWSFRVELIDGHRQIHSLDVMRSCSAETRHGNTNNVHKDSKVKNAARAKIVTLSMS